MSSPGRHWGRVFAAKPIDVKKAREFAKEFAVDFELGSVGPPTENDVLEVFQSARHSAPGPDGLPYGAWKATGRTGARATARGIEELMQGKPAPTNFNNSSGVFPAKGTADDDTRQMKRRLAGDTRPLSCKDTVNKGMAATVNRQLVGPIARNAHHAQEGFIKGRQGLNNVTTLDAASRVADLKAEAKSDPKLVWMPFLILLDYAAAFPSIAHLFIFTVLEAVGGSPQLMRFLHALYANNRCFANFDGKQFFLFIIESGILQGCPLSGSLFVIAADPMLRMLASVFPDATIKAFADDIGGVFKKLVNLTKLEAIFARFAEISGLRLKPAKSKIIPLGREPNGANLEEVRALVRVLAPNWARIGVDAVGEYLGFQVGQKGGTVASWQKPAQKFVERALLLGAAGLSAAEGTCLYNSSVAGVLGYVEQLCPLDKSVTKLEQGAVERALHALHNSVPIRVLHCGKQFGMINVVSIAARSNAALVRAARSTCSSWRFWSEELRQARVAHGPMLNCVPENESLRDNYWWDSEAFADALGRADREAPDIHLVRMD